MRRARGLKYNEPVMADLVYTKMTEEMKGFLMANVDGEHMEEEVAQYWMREVDPNWTEEDVTVPDLVEIMVDSTVVSVMMAGDTMAVTGEEDYEEGTV